MSRSWSNRDRKIIQNTNLLRGASQKDFPAFDFDLPLFRLLACSQARLFENTGLRAGIHFTVSGFQFPVVGFRPWVSTRNSKHATMVSYFPTFPLYPPCLVVKVEIRAKLLYSFYRHMLSSKDNVLVVKVLPSGEVQGERGNNPCFMSKYFGA